MEKFAGAEREMAFAVVLDVRLIGLENAWAHQLHFFPDGVTVDSVVLLQLFEVTREGPLAAVVYFVALVVDDKVCAAFVESVIAEMHKFIGLLGTPFVPTTFREKINYLWTGSL